MPDEKQDEKKEQKKKRKDEHPIFDVHHSNFENLLKTLLFTYLVVWVTIGVAILAVILFLAFGGVGQIISAATGFLPASLQSAIPTGFTAEQNTCITSAIGQQRFNELRSGSTPTSAEQAALQNCLRS